MAGLWSLFLPAPLWLASWSQTSHETSISLLDYRVTIEARRITGVSRNLSGLTYEASTKTLYAVINRPPSIIQLSTEGELLRPFPLPEGWDAEGIAHLRDNLFLITDEDDNLLHWVRIAPGAPEAELLGTTRLHLGWGPWPNLGFEGVSWNDVRSELLLVNEKWPRKVLRVSGLWPPAQAAEIAVREWWPDGWAGLPVSDLASVASDEISGDLLLLSEQSRLILQYGPDGRLVGLLKLRVGHAGLSQNVLQPEGIALSPERELFIVSEPNLFYRFSPIGTP